LGPGLFGQKGSGKQEVRLINPKGTCNEHTKARFWRTVAAILSTISEPVVELSQAQDYRGGIIVFQFFRRSAHLGGAVPQML
jgi:hypothetical protein